MLWALDECVYARTKDMQRNTTQKAAGGATSMHPLRRRLYARGPECTVVSSSEHPSLSHDRLIWSGLGRKPVWYVFSNHITSLQLTRDVAIFPELRERAPRRALGRLSNSATWMHAGRVTWGRWRASTRRPRRGPTIRLGRVDCGQDQISVGDATRRVQRVVLDAYEQIRSYDAPR